MESADGEFQRHGASRVSALVVGLGGGDQLHAHAVGIGEGDRLLCEAVERTVEGDAALGESRGPEVHGIFGDGEGRRGDLPGAASAFGRRRPRKESQDGAGVAGAVAVIQVVGGGVVEIDCEFDQAQAEEARVKVEIGLRIPRDRGDVVNPQNLFVHTWLFPMRPATDRPNFFRPL